MGPGDLSLFAAMKQKMQWHQARQGVLAENVANAETPGYRSRDLKVFSFSEEVGKFSSAQLTTTATNVKHLQISASSNGGFGIQRANSAEIKQDGNGTFIISLQ